MQGMLMLVDTGASISILPYKIWDELCDSEKSAPEPTMTKIRTGTNGKVDLKGVSYITFYLEGIKYKYPFYICGDARNPIIGFDFQQKFRYVPETIRKCTLHWKQEIARF